MGGQVHVGNTSVIYYMINASQYDSDYITRHYYQKNQILDYQVLNINKNITS